MLAVAGCKDDTGGALPDRIADAEIVFAADAERIVAAEKTMEIPVIYKNDGGEVSSCPYTLSLKAWVPLKAADLVSDYNRRNNTDFSLLPEGCFTLKAGTLAQGTGQTCVSIIIDQEKVGSEYKGWPFLLPLKLAANDTQIKSDAVLYVAVPAIVEKNGTSRVHWNTMETYAEILYASPGNGRSVIIFTEKDSDAVSTAETAFKDKGTTVAVLHNALPDAGAVIRPEETGKELLQIMEDRKDEWGGASAVGVMGTGKGAAAAAMMATGNTDMIGFQVLLDPEAEETGMTDIIHRINENSPTAYLAGEQDNQFISGICTAMEQSNVKFVRYLHESGDMSTWADFPASLFSWLEGKEYAAEEKTFSIDKSPATEASR